MFNQSPLIVGTFGSAFHSALFFAPEYTGTLVLISPEKINPRYPLIDSIKNYQARYLSCMKSVLEVNVQRAVDLENLAGDAKGKGASGSNREAESTDAPERR